MYGVSITESENDDFSIEVIIHPEKLSQDIYFDYKTKHRGLARYCANRVSSYFIPLHARLYPVAWLEKVFLRYIEEADDLYPMHHCRIVVEPTRINFTIKLAVYGAEDQIFHIGDYTRPIPINVLSEDPVDDKNSFPPIEWYQYQENLRKYMNLTGLGLRSIAKYMNIPEVTARNLMFYRSFEGDINTKNNFLRVLDWLEEQAKIVLISDTNKPQSKKLYG